MRHEKKKEEKKSYSNSRAPGLGLKERFLALSRKKASRASFCRRQNFRGQYHLFTSVKAPLDNTGVQIMQRSA